MPRSMQPEPAVLAWTRVAQTWALPRCCCRDPSEAPMETAGMPHDALGMEGVRAFRNWVQQAGVARDSAELTSHYPELEVERLTSMLRMRISVLADIEMVLYLAFLLGPQVMADCLHGVLQQRARAALRFGQRFPPDLAHALPMNRPCVLSPELGARPSSARQPRPAGAAMPAHAACGAPSCIPARPPLATTGLQPPRSTSTLVGADRRPPLLAWLGPLLPH